MGPSVAKRLATRSSKVESSLKAKQQTPSASDLDCSVIQSPGAADGRKEIIHPGALMGLGDMENHGLHATSLHQAI